MNPNVQTAEVVSPRAMLFVGIVAFHAVLGYFLANGLLHTTVDLLKPNMQGVIIPDESPEPPQQPKIIEPPSPAPLPFVVPDPEIAPITEQQSEPMFVASEQTAPEPVPVAPPVAAMEPPIRLVGRDVFPNTDAYYPARERRDGTEGTALVRACVDERGKLSGAPSIETSSGSTGLDSAAVRLAKDTRYAKSMKGDVAVPNCHRFRVTFSLKG